MENIYSDIAKRTGGNIYIGVVGPVRTGKSTLIKRIMEQLVIPCIDDPYRIERARDELPQSGSGKTIMTSEPKFIPEEAIEICPDGTSRLRIRMIDSVGYLVQGAVGATEDGTDRMVTTPWFDYEIPMSQAAELGTKKVMQEHCSIGLVVTTDGTVTELLREDYLEAEDRAIRDMQATGKPFLVIINSRDPHGAAAQDARDRILQLHGLDAAIADCQALNSDDISQLLLRLLHAFPMQQLQVHFPRWVHALGHTHPLKETLYRTLLECAENISTLSQVQPALMPLAQLEQIAHMHIRQTDLSTGAVECVITFPEALFYQILSDQTGILIENETQLMDQLVTLAATKREYDRVADALSSVQATGYGIVMPTAEQMTLQPPEVVRKGGTFGVKLKADAPSIHMVRVDVGTEISPMVGSEQQSQDLISYLSAEDPNKLWQSNLFGKTVYELIQEGLTAKLLRTPEDVRSKFRGTLTRIVNDGATGLICLIL